MEGSTAPSTQGSGVPAMASDSDQNRLRQPITSPICACDAAKRLDAGRARRLVEEAGDEIELHGEPRAALHA